MTDHEDYRPDPNDTYDVTSWESMDECEDEGGCIECEGFEDASCGLHCEGCCDCDEEGE